MPLFPLFCPTFTCFYWQRQNDIIQTYSTNMIIKELVAVALCHFNKGVWCVHFIFISQDSSEPTQGRYSLNIILLIHGNLWPNYQHFTNLQQTSHKCRLITQLCYSCTVICSCSCLMSFILCFNFCQQKSPQDPRPQKVELTFLLQNRSSSMKRLPLVQRREVKN